MKRRWGRWAAVPVVLALVAAACGDDDDNATATTAAPATTGATATSGATETTSGSTETTSGSTDTTEGGSTETTSGGSAPAEGTEDFGGKEITITGSERDDPSVIAINESLKAFGDRHNLKITFTGDADWETNINTQVQGGNPPDIGIFPQPGKLADFANDGSVKPLSDDAAASVKANWDEKYYAYSTVDGKLVGVPVKTDLKSIVWYKPAVFKEAGFEVPTTYKEFTDLIEKMKTDGDGRKPLCVGIESGSATGWPFTDWTEEMVLRQAGGDVYDQWVKHEIPFNDPKVVKAMQTVLDLWSEDNVFASGGTISATNFGDNAQALADDQCYMHRQANFFAGFFPPGTKFADGSADAIDVFYFPDIDGTHPVLTAGTFAAPFNDDPATMAVLAYMSTPEYAEIRQKAQTRELDGGVSGFVSAVEGIDESVYQPIEQNFIKILNDSKVVRFDGSDQMPAVVGSGSFWTEGTSAVNGDETAQQAADNIQASWPK
jgi:alpha-glucoside transport system substrate-binding protein